MTWLALDYPRLITCRCWPTNMCVFPIIFYILKLVCEYVPYSAQVGVNKAIAWIPRIPHHKIPNNKPFFNRPKLAFKKKRNVRTLTLTLIRDYLIKRSIDGFLFLNSPKKAQELFSLQVSHKTSITRAIRSRSQIFEM